MKQRAAGEGNRRGKSPCAVGSRGGELRGHPNERKADVSRESVHSARM